MDTRIFFSFSPLVVLSLVLTVTSSGPSEPSERALDHTSVDLYGICFSKGVLEGWIVDTVFRCFVKDG